MMGEVTNYDLIRKLLFPLLFFSLGWGIFCTNPASEAVSSPKIAIVADSVQESGMDNKLSLFWLGERPTAVIWKFYRNSMVLDSVSSVSVYRKWNVADTGRILVKVEAEFEGPKVAVDSTIVRVAFSPPEIQIVGDTLVMARDSSNVRLEVISAKRPIAGYIWQVDGMPPDTSFDNVRRFVWMEKDSGSHELVVFAVDSMGARSVPDTHRVNVAVCRPTISLEADTTAVVGTLSRFRALVHAECGKRNVYVWSAGNRVDTTAVPTIRIIWDSEDTGWISVVVRAVTEDGFVSEPDSAGVRVIRHPPVITIGGDTSGYIGDTLEYAASVSDTVVSVAHYLWAFDQGPFSTITHKPLVKYAWGQNDAGLHVVKVKAVDSRGIESSIDSLFVRISEGRPVAVITGDTLVSSTDVAELVVSAHDSNGTIEKFLWSPGQFSWADSSEDSTYRLSYTGNDTVKLVTGVRDDDGLMAFDSITVRFNIPPDPPRLIYPSPGDTVLVSTADGSLQNGRISFSFSVNDPNGIWDSTNFWLSVGETGSDMGAEYKGYDTAAVLSGLDTGSYRWRLRARDTYGDSSFAEGQFLVMAQKKICFIGHSIVSGVGGERGKGGFRKQVLSEMRNASGDYETVKSVGTLQTGILFPDSDDSCLALSGASAGQSRILLSTSEGVKPDSWILMLGVNWGYHFTETQNILTLLSEMRARNTKADMYVLNGIPYPPSFWSWEHTRLDNFNEQLSDSVSYRRDSLGWNIEFVDAYSAFMGDSVRNETLFADDLHPNQEGYDTLAVLLLRSMGLVE